MDNDDLNEILTECAQLRGCYPLMHRTLHEFDWFASCVIFGWTQFEEYTAKEHIKKHPEAEKAMQEKKEEYQKIFNKWHGAVTYDNELIALAKAFREYCHEEYDSDVAERKKELDEFMTKLKKYDKLS
ncbi:MAG: hypothetical protein PHP63_08690 [Candidatus Marinimicrobia bacterium]|nr:hypothetical protein [Candidatus Neomarinimicrobiota bacterium]